MTVLDWLIVVTVVVAIINVLGIVYAHRPILELSPAIILLQKSARTVLAVWYTVSYVWLQGHLGRRLEWSKFMAGFGFIAFPVVWVDWAFVASLYVWWRSARARRHA